MTIKLPVSVEGTLILDADGEVVASVKLPSGMSTAEARDEAYSRANTIAAALNATQPAPLSPLPTVVVPWRGEMGGAVLVLPTPRQWVRFALWARRRMQPQENTP